MASKHKNGKPPHNPVRHLREEAEQHGYRLVRARSLVKRSVQVDEKAWRNFARCASTHGLRLNEALNLALEDWADKMARVPVRDEEEF